MSLIIRDPYHWPITLQNATPTEDGIMSAADKAKLNTYPATPGNITAIKTAAYTAALGQTVLYNPAGGQFYLDLPSLSGSGQDVAFANVTASAAGILVRGAPGGTPITGTGSINNGSTTLNVVSGLSGVMQQVGDTITVAGAGPGGGLLTTTIANFGLGTIDLDNAASTTVVAAACVESTRQAIDGAAFVSLAAAWRALTVRDCGTLWKKMSQF